MKMPSLSPVAFCFLGVRFRPGEIMGTTYCPRSAEELSSDRDFHLKSLLDYNPSYYVNASQLVSPSTRNPTWEPTRSLRISSKFPAAWNLAKPCTGPVLLPVPLLDSKLPHTPKVPYAMLFHRGAKPNALAKRTREYRWLTLTGYIPARRPPTCARGKILAVSTTPVP